MAGIRGGRARELFLEDGHLQLEHHLPELGDALLEGRYFLGKVVFDDWRDARQETVSSRKRKLGILSLVACIHLPRLAPLWLCLAGLFARPGDD